MERTADQKALNLHVEIMQVEVQAGNVRRPKAVKARALPIARAVEWTERATELDKALGEARKDKERYQAAQLALLAILDHLLAYDTAGEWPVEAIKKQATPEQVLGAFYQLRELNDPFFLQERLQREQTALAVKMLEALKGTNSPALEKFIQKHVQEASSDSEASSG
jgi:hypothetical protein